MLDCKHTIYYNWHTSHIVKTQTMWTKFCYGTKFCVQRLFLISDFTTQKEGRKTHSVQECVFFCPKRKVFYVACFNSGAVFQQQQKGRESNVCYTSFALIKATLLLHIQRRCFSWIRFKRGVVIKQKKATGVAFFAFLLLLAVLSGSYFARR